MRKPNRLVSALGTSSLWQLVGSAAVFAVYMLAPAALAAVPPIAVAIASVGLCIGGLVTGWRHASQIRREIDAVEHGVPAQMVQEVVPQRGRGKSFVQTLQAERAENQEAVQSR